MTVIVICSQQFMQCQSSEQVYCQGRDISSLNFISQVICTARFPADGMRCDFINVGSSLCLWKKFVMSKKMVDMPFTFEQTCIVVLGHGLLHKDGFLGHARKPTSHCL